MKVLDYFLLFVLFFCVVLCGSAQPSVRLINEKVIDQADDVQPWGYFQFPVLSKSTEGLTVSWSMNSDNVRTLGKGNTVRKVSRDNGATWNYVNWTGATEGTVTPNGCRIKLFTKPSVKFPANQKIKIGELVNSYSKKKVSFYYDKDLPPSLRGAYLALDCGKGFKSFKVTIEDPEYIRYVENGMLPFNWWGNIVSDKSSGKLYAAMSPSYYLENGVVQPSGIIIYESSNNGSKWRRVGLIKYDPDSSKDRLASKKNISDGFMEPSFLQLKNGVFLCVIRATNGLGNRPLYVSRSLDQGRTWSVPKAITKSGVMPKVVQLDNGVLVLSTGRPGIQLYFSTDNGKTWSSSRTVLATEKGTCGYTGLQAVGANKFMVVYSDFSRKNSKGKVRKAIVSKTFIVNK